MKARNVPLPTKVFWGIGQAGEGIQTAAFNSFLLFFYTQILGVSASLTALALAIAIACDAVSDPLVGSISDKFKSKWGRRHPFIVLSALPMSLCLFFLFSPPADMSETFYFGWVLVFAIAVRTFLTLYQIPHLALGAEMVSDYVERNFLFSIGLIFMALAAYGFYPIMLWLVFPPDPDLPQGLYNAGGYPVMAAVAASIAFCAILISAWGTRGEIPYLSEPAPDTQPVSFSAVFFELKIAFSNPSYRSIFFGLILGTIVLAVEAVMTPFMGTHFWALETDELKFIPLGVVLGLPLGLTLAVQLPKYIDKKWCLIVPAAISILNGNVLIVLRLFDLLPENGDPIIVPLLTMNAFFGAVIVPVVYTTINSMFADIADEIELETEKRQEGIIFSARAFATKCANGLGTLFGGLALDAIAFPEKAGPGGVSADVVFNLGLVQGPVTSIFTFGGLILYLGYKLSRGRHAEIVQTLHARRTNNLS